MGHPWLQQPAEAAGAERSLRSLGGELGPGEGEGAVSELREREQHIAELEAEARRRVVRAAAP